MLTSRALLYSSSTSGSDPQRIPQYGSLAAVAGNNPPSATAATTAATRAINLRMVPPLLHVSDPAARRRLREVSGLHDEHTSAAYWISQGPNGLNSSTPALRVFYVRRRQCHAVWQARVVASRRHPYRTTWGRGLPVPPSAIAVDRVEDLAARSAAASMAAHQHCRHAR